MWIKLLVSALLFFIISNPALYKITRGLGGWVASPEGLPHTGGLLLHAVVFALTARIIMRALWRRKMRKYYSPYADEYAEEYADEYAEEYADEYAEE